MSYKCNCPQCGGTPRDQCEAIEELTTLRARVRELEWLHESDLKTVAKFAGANIDQAERILELEDAMPTADRMGIMAGQFAYFGDMKTAGECMKMADRIETVMRKEKE